MRIAKGLEPLLKRAALRSVPRRGNHLVPPIAPAAIRRIMIYRPERFGDMLATIPLIRALKAHLPKTELHLWTSEQGRELLEPETSVDSVTVISGKSSDRSVAMETEPFDLVVDLRMRDSVNSILACDAASRDGILVGWGKDRLRAYYDWAPKIPSSDDYAITHAVGIMALFGGELTESYSCLPHFTEQEQQFATGVIKGAKLPVMCNLSAGDPNRSLPESHWRTIIDHLTSHVDATVLLNALAPDRSKAEQLAAHYGAAVRVLSDDMTFRQAACAASRVRLLISPDTSLVHTSAAAGVPAVVLYLARTDMRMSWIPPFEHVHALIAEKDQLSQIPVSAIIEAVTSATHAFTEGAAS